MVQKNEPFPPASTTQLLTVCYHMFFWGFIFLNFIRQLAENLHAAILTPEF